jgi:MFS family permease
MAKRELSKHSENKWIILALLALAQFMVVLDVAIVNVALPSIAKELHFAQNNLQWVVTAYTLTFGGFLLLGGRAADLFGRRRIFITAVTWQRHLCRRQRCQLSFRNSGKVKNAIPLWAYGLVYLRVEPR